MEKDRPEDARTPRVMNDTGEITIRVPVGHAEHFKGQETEAIGTSDGLGKVVAGGKAADGGIQATLIGRPAQNEEDSLSTSRILVQRLNRDGANWSEPILNPVRDDDADCLAYDGGKILRISVTRAAPTHFFQKAARSGQSVISGSAEDFSDLIHAAAVEKHSRLTLTQRVNLHLGLNAQDTLAHALRAVVDAFGGKHGGWAAASGFAAIWIVGPTADLVYRLDT